MEEASIDDSNGFPWDGPFLGATLYNHVMTPNDHSCSARVNMFAATASSRHPGGVNVLLMDGSVRAVKDSIDPRAWWAAGTPAGGEVESSID